MNATLTRIRRINREQELYLLRNVGNPFRSKLYQTKREKSLDPRRQRKNWRGWVS